MGKEKIQILQILVSKGDRGAFVQLYNIYARKVFSFAMNILHSELLAEEVMHEALLKIWMMGSRLAEVDNFDGYLYSACKNIALNRLKGLENEKRKNSIITKDWTEADCETQDTIDFNDTRSFVKNVVDKLPKQRKKAFTLCHLDGYKYDEAAAIMGLSVNTIAVHVRLALKYVRKHVNNLPGLFAALVYFTS